MRFDDITHGVQGWREGQDRGIRATAYVLGYDATTRMVTVSGTEGGEGTDVPALEDIDWTAVIGGTCWVLRDPSTGVTAYALAPVVYPVEEVVEDPLPPARAQVTGVSGSTITVLRADGVADTALALASYTSPAVGDQVWLSWAPDLASCAVIARIGTPPTIPAAPSSVTQTRSGSTVTTTWGAAARATSYQIQISANGGASWQGPWNRSATTDTGTIAQGTTRQARVRSVNAAGTSAWVSANAITWPAPAPKPPQLVTRTATIWPTDSGTYSASKGAWDRWNTSRYGGASTLYQGSRGTSGHLIGAAFYAERIMALGAVAITSMRVILRGADLSEASHPPITVQSITNGSRPGGAPTTTGPSVTGNPGRSGVDRATLDPSTYEPWRVGAHRGLATVGAGYGAVRGTSAADGMALEVTYQVYA